MHRSLQGWRCSFWYSVLSKLHDDLNESLQELGIIPSPEKKVSFTERIQKKSM